MSQEYRRIMTKIILPAFVGCSVFAVMDGIGALFGNWQGVHNLTIWITVIVGAWTVGGWILVGLKRSIRAKEKK